MKQKDLILLLGSSCLLVIAWIIFSFINKSVTSTLDETLSQTVKPISGSFDTQTLQRVKDRQQVQPVYSLSTQTPPTTTPAEFPSTTPTISLTPTPVPLLGDDIATDSADITL